jgi:hypothetical protein
MLTRMEKWAKYRAQIAATPDSRFKSPKSVDRVMGSADKALIATSSQSGASLHSVASKPRKKAPTPYLVYARRKKWRLLAKFALLGASVAGFACLWIYWVMAV